MGGEVPPLRWWYWLCEVRGNGRRGTCSEAMVLAGGWCRQRYCTASCGLHLLDLNKSSSLATGFVLFTNLKYSITSLKRPPLGPGGSDPFMGVGGGGGGSRSL